MHGLIPKGDLFCDNIFCQLSPGATLDYRYYCGPWFCRDKEEVDFDKSSNFFREKRRTTFSDVAHAKTLTASRKLPETIAINYSGPTWVRELRRNRKFVGSWNDTFTWRELSEDYGGNDWAGMAVVQSDGKLSICVRISGNYYQKPDSGLIGAGGVDVFLGKYVSDRSSTSINIKYFVNVRLQEFRIHTDGTITWNGSGVPDWLKIRVKYSWKKSHGGYGNGMAFSQTFCDGVLEDLYTEAFIGKINNYSRWSQTYWSTQSTAYDKGVYNIFEPYAKNQIAFKLHEPEVIFDHYDDIMFGRGMEAYVRNLLIEKAYLAAVQSIPRMSDNNISNLLEIASFIKSLVIDHKVEIPKSLNDYWLSYRYSYSTTKMDANDAIKFMHRYRDLGQWSSLKCRGSHTEVLEDGTMVKCRCTLDIAPKELALLNKVWKSLYTFGLTPSFYVVWDMIPYSFIVDWLIPVGDIVASWDTEREFTSNYDIKSLIFSLSYDDGSNAFYQNHYYTRWLSSTPPQLHGYYFFEDDPSSATVGKRILDTIALTVHLPLP
jgi:hypothetical protein